MKSKLFLAIIYLSTLLLNKAQAQCQDVPATLSDPEATVFANFGFSVDVSADLMIIGKPVDLNNDPSGTYGAAFIYRQDAATGLWNLEQQLESFDPQPNEQFGTSVAISAKVALVGAALSDINDAQTNAGSVYVYRLDNSGTWLDYQVLTASDAVTEGIFGHAVDIDGPTAIIGAIGANGAGVANNGAAYVFKQDISGNWTEVQKLSQSDGTPNMFGYSVAIEGGRAIIGSVFGSGITVATGAAYIYEEAVDGSWNLSASLAASDGATGDFFGNSVALFGSFAIVGSLLQGQFDGASGAAYIYEHKGNTWTEFQKLNDLSSGNFYGSSVSINKKRVLVGAHRDLESKGTTIGTAYLWQLNEEEYSWSLTDELSDPDPNSGSFYGQSVALASGDPVIGAHPGTSEAVNGSVHVYSCSEESAEKMGGTANALTMDHEIDNRVQLYPNPISSEATLAFSFPESDNLRVEIFDITGKKVTTLMDQNIEAGIKYQVLIDAGLLQSGLYFYRLTTQRQGSFHDKIQVLK